MKKYLLLIILFSTFNLLAGGFKDLGNNARVVALGGAYIAGNQGSYGLFYNPASVYNIDFITASTSYANLYPGIQDDNLNYIALSAVAPVWIFGNLGLGGTFLNTNLWQENMFYITYAREVVNNFAVGGNMKLMRWSASAAPGESALSYFGFTFDAGAHYTMENLLPNSSVSFGFVIQNITQPSIASNGSSDANLPMNIGFGVSYYSREYNYLLLLDAIREEEDIKLRAGAEFLGMKQQVFGANTEFYIRMGFDGIVSETNSSQKGINGGFGIKVDRLDLDYAYVFPLELKNVGGSHKISLNYNFNF